MPQEEKVTVTLPQEVQKRFGALRQKLFSVETISTAAFILSAVLLSALLLFISDRLWDTPQWLRLAFLLGAVCAAVAGFLWWARRWIIRPRDHRALAHMVQKRYPRLGDRLLGIVELADEKTRPSYFSHELYQAAIGQVSEESLKYDFTKAVEEKGLRRGLCYAGGLIALAALALLLAPKAGWNALVRWALPLAEVPRFTLVELAALPDKQVAPHGENFTLKGQVRYRSFWKPATVKLQIGAGEAMKFPVKDGQFEAEIPGQVEDTPLLLRAGDDAHVVQVEARHRPALLKASALVELPDYLGHPPREENVQGGSLSVVEGSSATVHATTTREIRKAFVAIANGEPQPAVVRSNTVVSPKFPVQDVSVLSFRWEDSLGLTNSRPWSLGVQSFADAPALPEIADLFRDVAILETEVLPIRVRARDDFGVKQLGLLWASDAQSANTNSPVKKDFLAEATSKDAAEFEQTFNFSPGILQIPPESTVEIRAFAVDYFPDRERSETPVYRIHVVGNARHAEMIRQNLESLLVHLEEVSRLQEKIASETRDLKDLQKLDTAEAAKKAEELQQEQDRNAAQLKELAQEGMKSLREALRNPAFNEEMLMEWTKDLHQMQKVAEQEMKQASQSLQQASQSQENREQKLGEALEKEEQAVQALQAMQKEVNQNLDEMQALTLAQRLRALGGNEKKIEGHLQSSIPDTIGLMPQELPSRYQRANTQLAGLQADTQTTSAELQSEISRFYERTQKPNYGQVSQEIVEKRTGEELDRIRGLIQENIGMEAMQNLGSWAEQFETWADLLEPKSSGEEGGGSGEGSGGEQKDDTALRHLMALLRYREKQLNIQHRTSLLHEYIEEQRTYKDGAVLLAASQAKLNSDVTRQAVENPFTMLEEAYNDTVTSMTDVEQLLDQPKTDEETRGAQTKSLANLTDLINLLNEQAKQQSSSSSSGSGSESASSEQMAFLMQMMSPQMKPGMQGGQTAGGNMSGGGTDRASDDIQGNSSGKPGEGRAVKKSAGLPQNYPTEFRQALENYFKALEASENK